MDGQRESKESEHALMMVMSILSRVHRWQKCVANGGDYGKNNVS